MKVNPNSPKFLSLLGIVLLIVPIIFQSNSLIMVFAFLSGFLFLIIAVIKAIINKLSKPTDTNMPQKFWPIMGIFLLLFFGVCYAGSKSPPPKKQEIAKVATATPTASKEVIQQEIPSPTVIPTLASPTLKPTPTPTKKPTPTTQQPTSTPTIKQPTPTVESGITEDYVRTALTKTNKIIDTNSLVKIEIFDNLGTEDNSTDKIVHIYFKPLSIWDEKAVVSQSSVMAVKSMKVLFTNPNITHIVFWTLGDFIDSYGNSNEATALRVGLKSTTASKLNWDNFIPMVELDYKKLFEIADDKYVHPSIAKALNWSWR